ncbi:organomercurial lyase [Prauserella oleivorans]|uniref:Alkylmercury lyase n=2 Tax=Prauserella TaxID=142577 RepID=A0A318LST4_9PSEU|nr:organomercurial lyase [Prauserella flavalba]PXY25559.1 hypothetical protein BA062_25740 [Prauserella flavalba]
MTSTHANHAVTELTRPGGPLDLGHDQARLVTRMLRLLAGEGQPVTHDHALDTITELGIDRARADALLDTWTERDDDGLIVGLGVTYNPTPHEMTIDGVRMWAWYAMDTLIFTHILDKPIAIASTTPGSGDVVTLHASPTGITHLQPVGAVATQRVPGSDQVDLSSTTAIWGTFCHHNLFFPNQAQAEQWAADRDDIAILSMPDAFTAARDMAAALLRYEPEGTR